MGTHGSDRTILVFFSSPLVEAKVQNAKVSEESGRFLEELGGNLQSLLDLALGETAATEAQRNTPTPSII
jgi:hypothetical protein